MTYVRNSRIFFGFTRAIADWFDGSVDVFFFLFLSWDVIANPCERLALQSLLF